MTETHVTHVSTRRQLLYGSAVAAAATAALPGLLSPAPALAAQIGDAGVLEFLLRAEGVVLYAYQRAVASGALSAAALPVLRTCLAQERQHIAALSVNAVRIGGVVPAAVADSATFDLELRELRIKRDPATLRTEREFVSFLIRLEEVAASVYHFAIEQLTDDKLLQTAAQIMANEGQHATILSELVNPGNVKRAVPSAFVGGSP